jgi:hypothetical protein
MRITSRTQESQANETFSEVFYFRYFPFPIEREALFSQAFRLTIRAAGKLIDESSTHFDNPPISNLVAGVMGNRLKGFLGRYGARPPDVELLGKFLAKEISRDEFVRRDLFYQSCDGRWTRQQHFACTAEKSYAVLGNVDEGIFFGLHILLLSVAVCFGRICAQLHVERGGQRVKVGRHLAMILASWGKTLSPVSEIKARNSDYSAPCTGHGC